MWSPTTDYWYVSVHVEQAMIPLKCKHVHSVKLHREKQSLFTFNLVTMLGDPLTLDLSPFDHGGSLFL